MGTVVMNSTMESTAARFYAYGRMDAMPGADFARIQIVDDFVQKYMSSKRISIFTYWAAYEAELRSLVVVVLGVGSVDDSIYNYEDE
jgi:hypothetical protein